MTAAIDLSWNIGHLITVIGTGAVVVGQWFVFSYRINSLEKVAAENRAEIKALKEAATKGPSLLCSLHEQRITKLEEEMRIQYLDLKSGQDTIIKLLGVRHRNE